MVHKAEADVDRYSSAIDKWVVTVRNWLTVGSTLDMPFLSDHGLGSQFVPEPTEGVPAKFLPVHKSYLDRRLTRLQEILRRMSDSDRATTRRLAAE